MIKVLICVMKNKDILVSKGLIKIPFREYILFYAELPFEVLIK